MIAHTPRLRFSLDPLIAEAKRRGRRRRLLAGMALVALALVAVGGVLALRPSGAGGGPTRSSGGAAGQKSGRAADLRDDARAALQRERVRELQLRAQAAIVLLRREERAIKQREERAIKQAASPTR